MVNSLLSTKDLDLHLLTSRVAGMSCPTDGMDLSSYKNSIDDIRQILEARHAGHYAVFNLCEKGRIKFLFLFCLELPLAKFRRLLQNSMASDPTNSAIEPICRSTRRRGFPTVASST